MNVHVARVAFLRIDSSTGQILKGDDQTKTIREHMQTSSDHRVLADSTIPNTSGHPTVKDYIEAEADDNYVVHYMDQNMIITYERTASGGFVS